LTPAEHVRVATHLDTCAECALIVSELQQVVREASTLGPIEPPARVWEKLAQSIAQSPQPKAHSPEPTAHSFWPRYAWALATAALVVMAFFVGRVAQQREDQAASQQASADTARRTSTDRTAVRERVLLVAVGDHLERSQMVLVELAHAETQGVLDISAERQLADDLVASNRLYRQTAQQMGQAHVAGLLDELERVLVEVARGPSTVSMQQLTDIQQRIEALGIVFKMKVTGSDIRPQPVS
jgi:hypothetical protein